MAEMLAVIAIMAILAGLIIVSLVNIMRDMQQVELDGTAREIFVAAQNHLTTADSEGLLASELSKGKRSGKSGGSNGNGSNGGYLGTQAEAESTGDIYYFTVGGAGTAPDGTKGILDQMLPYGSIDEAIRAEGTYVIRYNAKSATVLDVFYAAKTPTTLFTASTSGFSFSDADYTRLFPEYTGDTSQKKELRRSYENSAGKTAMIGYYGDYGGSDRQSGLEPATPLQRPTLEVRNGERLVATVKNPMHTNALSDGLTLQLVITGETSKNEKVVNLLKAGKAESGAVHVDTGKDGLYNVYLDEVALADGATAKTVAHFADLFCDDTKVGGTGPLIPGENVTIQVKLFSTKKLTNVAYSTKATCNSLFDSYDEDKGEVAIANMRHLENLGTKISGFNPNDPRNTENGGWGNAKGPLKAKQVSDLSWVEFAAAVAGGGQQDGQADNQQDGQDGTPQDGQASATGVYVLKKGGETRDTAASGPFVPVDLPDGFAYDGASGEEAAYRISDIATASTSGDAGVFESCKDGKISNLEILNPSITAQTGNAGGLVGSLNGTTVENVLVHHDHGTDVASSDYSVSGTVSAGGLVGSMTGGSVTQCAAAVLVSASGADASAGGLVGMASAGASGSATISRSYSGGHTEGGAYTDNANVAATGESGVAGGLVGTLAGTVTDCYSTCSASGSIAGGLVGSVGAGSSVAKSDSRAYSYSTGKVSGTTTGAFVGANYGSVVGRYLEWVNPGLKAIGQPETATDTCKAADDSLSEFREFEGSGRAHPYEQVLYYPFKNLSEISGLRSDALDSVPEHVKSHYGDWPVIGTPVMNESVSG